MQGLGQPAQLIGAAPQAGHQEHPGGRPRHRPELERQVLLAMGDRQTPALRCPISRRALLLQQDPVGEGQQRCALGKRQGLQRLQGHLLLEQLLLPALGQLLKAVEVDRELPDRKRPHQLQDGHLLLLFQQGVQGAENQGARVAVLRAEQDAQLFGDALTGPAAHHLLGKAALLHQRGVQQLMQLRLALGIQEAEPDPQLTGAGLGITAPAFELGEVQGEIQSIEADVQFFGGPQGGSQQRSEGENSGQQTAAQCTAATQAGWLNHGCRQQAGAGGTSFPRHCGNWPLFAWWPVLAPGGFCISLRWCFTNRSSAPPRLAWA